MDNIYFNMMLLLFDNKKNLCVYFFFLWGYPHRKIVFNLGECNFSMRVRPTKKIIFDGEPTKKLIFCHSIFVGYFLIVHYQKNIFLSVFVFFYGFFHTQKYSRFQ